jgi:hypothetical protein
LPPGSHSFAAGKDAKVFLVHGPVAFATSALIKRGRKTQAGVEMAACNNGIPPFATSRTRSMSGYRSRVPGIACRRWRPLLFYTAPF